jgi:hypothetical protein
MAGYSALMLLGIPLGLAYITDKFHIRKGFPSSSRIILEERGQEGTRADRERFMLF